MHDGHHHHAPLSLDSKHTRQATYVAVTVAFGLITLKLYGWWQTDSVSLFSSLLDSFLDLFVSLINLFAVHYALKPADDDHRFGHNAIEDIAGLLQAAFLAGSALMITLEAANRFIAAEPVHSPELGMSIMGISIIATLLLVLYQHYAIRREGSLVIEADAMHYVGDLLTNIAIILSLYLSSAFGIHWADPVLALGIAAILFRGAWKIGHRAFRHLMDEEMPEADKARIIAILDGEYDAGEILGYHELKTRYSGRKAFIQMHLDLDATLTLQQAHTVADRVETKLREEFAHADVIIHEDPVGAKHSTT